MRCGHQNRTENGRVRPRPAIMTRPDHQNAPTGPTTTANGGAATRIRRFKRGRRGLNALQRKRHGEIIYPARRRGPSSEATFALASFSVWHVQP
jgi:hypothetical protein